MAARLGVLFSFPQQPVARRRVQSRHRGRSRGRHLNDGVRRGLHPRPDVERNEEFMTTDVICDWSPDRLDSGDGMVSVVRHSACDHDLSVRFSRVWRFPWWPERSHRSYCPE